MKIQEMIVIRQVTEPEQALIPPLCELLIDTVHNGASVGFLAPLSIDRATRYWQQVFASLGDGLLLWVAETDGRIAGSVQLAPSQKENGRHRAELQKLFVHSEFQGQSISTQLMSAAETAAACSGSYFARSGHPRRLRRRGGVPALRLAARR